MRGVGLNHVQIFILAAFVEAEPEAEPVGERDFFLDCLVRIDRRRTLVFNHVARQEVAAVGGGVENHIVGTALDTALKRRFQRLVTRVACVERQIVAKQDEPERRAAQKPHELGQSVYVLAVNFDQFQRQGSRSRGCRDVRMRGFHKR